MWLGFKQIDFTIKVKNTGFLLQFIEVLQGIEMSTTQSLFLNLHFLHGRHQIAHELTSGLQLSFPVRRLSQLGQTSELVTIRLGICSQMTEPHVNS